MTYTEFAVSFRRLLDNPAKVAVVCGLLFVVSVILNGNAFRLWGLHRDFARIQFEIENTHDAIGRLNSQLKEAKDPMFIERQARDKLDLAGEHDLVFVFADE